MRRSASVANRPPWRILQRPQPTPTARIDKPQATPYTTPMKFFIGCFLGVLFTTTSFAATERTNVYDYYWQEREREQTEVLEKAYVGANACLFALDQTRTHLKFVREHAAKLRLSLRKISETDPPEYKRESQEHDVRHDYVTRIELHSAAFDREGSDRLFYAALREVEDILTASDSWRLIINMRSQRRRLIAVAVVLEEIVKRGKPLSASDVSNLERLIKLIDNVNSRKVYVAYIEHALEKLNSNQK